MDDGRQTLGIMELIAEDEKTTVFRLATNELPWLNNKNDVRIWEYPRHFQIFLSIEKYISIKKNTLRIIID